MTDHIAVKLWVLLIAVTFGPIAVASRATDEAGTTPTAGDSGFAVAQGLRIYYQDYGTGSPLILVHGWGADSESHWVASGWVELLSEHRRVIVMDVRGHGRSDKPLALEPYSYARMSTDVMAVMDQLKLQKVDFMGYSMGAFIGAYLLGQHPERFRSMVLGGIGDESESTAELGAVIAQALRSENAENIEHPYGRAVRAFAVSNPRNDLEALAYSAQKMWPEGYPLNLAGSRISEATFPILVVNGADDHPYVDSVSKLIEALPQARYHEIPGTDHMTVAGDVRFKNVVTGFLEALETN